MLSVGSRGLDWRWPIIMAGKGSATLREVRLKCVSGTGSEKL